MRPDGFCGAVYNRNTVLPVSMLHLTNTCILHISWSWLHFNLYSDFFPIISQQAK